MLVMLRGSAISLGVPCQSFPVAVMLAADGQAALALCQL
jgi:hypothetical protein